MIFPRCIRPVSHPARDGMEVDLGTLQDASSEVSSVTALDFDDDDSITMDMLGTMEEVSSVGRSIVDYREVRPASTYSPAASLGKSTSHVSDNKRIPCRKPNRLKFNSSLDMSSSSSTGNTFIGSSSSFSYDHNMTDAGPAPTTHPKTPQFTDKAKCSVSIPRDVAVGTKEKSSSLYFI